MSLLYIQSCFVLTFSIITCSYYSTCIFCFWYFFLTIYYFDNLVILLLSSLRSRLRYHRAQWDSNFLSVCCLSVICLSVIKLLPAYGTDHYQNSYLDSLDHCEGQSEFDIDRSSISRPPPPTSPKKDTQNENFYFLTY